MPRKLLGYEQPKGHIAKNKKVLPQQIFVKDGKRYFICYLDSKKIVELTDMSKGVPKTPENAVIIEAEDKKDARRGLNEYLAQHDPKADFEKIAEIYNRVDLSAQQKHNKTLKELMRADEE